MKRILVFAPSTTYAYFLPHLLLNFQRHYEQFGKHSDQWEWMDPPQDLRYKDLDEFADTVIAQGPIDLLCLGLYVWNEEICLGLGERVKRAYPNCIIVIGGPQTSFLKEPDWFERHPYVDYGCHVSGYGELFLTPLLDQITEGNVDEKSIPLLCKPVKGGYEWVGSKPNPRDYKWPTGIYRKDDERLLRWAKEAQSRNETIGILLETNRGCPYSCTYCEWGGGIGTKISFKPIEEVEAEISCYEQLNVDTVLVVDANFGIVDRDVDITNLIVNSRNNTGFPNSFEVLGPAKNNHDRVLKINDIRLDNGLCNDWVLNVQTLDEQILKNIKRTDIPWKERLVPYMERVKKHDLGVIVQTIYPLPGWSFKHFLEEIDFQAEYGFWHLHRFELDILPNTELADQIFEGQWGYKTKLGRYQSSLSFKTDLLEPDPTRVPGLKEQVVDLRNKITGKVLFALSTETITAKELVDARWLGEFIKTTQVFGLFSDLPDWLATQGIPHSEYYNKLVNDWLWSPTNSVNKVKILQQMHKDFYSDMNDREIAEFRYRFPIHDIPFLTEPVAYFAYAFLTDSTLVQEWSDWVYENWGSQAGDLADLLKARLVGLDWNPATGQVHESFWDWRPWIYDRQQPISGKTKLKWNQKYFRKQYLPIFRNGDLMTAKVWILAYMSPINLRTYKNDPWRIGNDENYHAWYWEEVNEN